MDAQWAGSRTAYARSWMSAPTLWWISWVYSSYRSSGSRLKPEQFVQVLPRLRRDRHHRHSQLFGQPRDVYLVAFLAGLVHEVQRHDQRAFQLQQLYRQVHVALYIGGVDYVDDGVRRLFPFAGSDDVVAGDYLLHGVRGQ